MRNPHASNLAAMGLTQSVWDTSRAPEPVTKHMTELAKGRAAYRVYAARKSAEKQALRDNRGHIFSPAFATEADRDKTARIVARSAAFA